MREAARAALRNGYPCVFILNQSSALGSLRSRTFSTAVQEPEPVTQDYPFGKIAFIGSGRMAEAMVAPIVNTGLQPADKVSIFDVHQKTMDRVVEAYDIQGSRSIEECVTGADLICLAVKPQNCEVVFQEIRDMKDKGLCHDNATILSIIAGKPMDSFLPTGIDRIAQHAHTKNSS
jgi:hypothetical protein